MSSYKLVITGDPNHSFGWEIYQEEDNWLVEAKYGFKDKDSCLHDAELVLFKMPKADYKIYYTASKDYGEYDKIRLSNKLEVEDAH